MSLYHDTKDGALLAGAPLADMGFEVKVEFEPDNGWVLVVIPTRIDQLAQVSDAWLDWCEIDLCVFGNRIKRRPAYHKKPPQAKKPVPPPPPPPPPKKGTAK